MVDPATPELDRSLARASVYFSLLAALSMFAPWLSETRYIRATASQSTSHWWLWQILCSVTDARLTIPLASIVCLLVANLFLGLLAIRRRRVCLMQIWLISLVELALCWVWVGVTLGSGTVKASVGLYVSGVALLVVLICDITRLWDWMALLPDDGASV